MFVTEVLKWYLRFHIVGQQTMNIFLQCEDLLVLMPTLMHNV